MSSNESWETVWSSRKSRGFLHNTGAFLAEYGDLQRIVFNSLKRTGLLAAQSSVLEIGCGTAPVMAMLADCSSLRCGVDISCSSAMISRDRCMASVADGRFLPFADESFDLVYSTGVMDLYDDRNARLFLQEMERVLKSSGRIVAINARTGCQVHSIIMKYLQNRKRWKYGSKRTFSTLSKILPDRLITVHENGRGAVFQLRFVSYLFENRELLRRMYHFAFLLLSLILYPLNKLPGAVLVTEMKKK